MFHGESTLFKFGLSAQVDCAATLFLLRVHVVVENYILCRVAPNSGIRSEVVCQVSPTAEFRGHCVAQMSFCLVATGHELGLVMFSGQGTGGLQEIFFLPKEHP